MVAIIFSPTVGAIVLVYSLKPGKYKILYIYVHKKIFIRKNHYLMGKTATN